MMPIFWISNLRIKSLVPAANLLAAKTHTCDFPTGSATVVMRCSSRKNPFFTIHFRTHASPYKTWDGKAAWRTSTLRVHHLQGQIPVLQLNGFTTAEFTSQIEEVVAHVKSLIHVTDSPRTSYYDLHKKWLRVE